MPRRPLRHLNLRALLAGGTTTTALIAPSVIAFLSLAVYVGFDGVPFGGGDDRDRTAIPVGATSAQGNDRAGSQGSGSNPGSRTVAARISPAAAAAASRPGRGENGLGGPGSGAGTGPGAPGTAPGPGAQPPGGQAPGGPGGGGESPSAPPGSGSGGSGPPAGGGSGGGDGSGGGGSSSGLLGDTVSNLEQATDPIVDLPLGEATKGITDPLDETVNGALNGVGGLLGNPNLGDQVGKGLKGATDGLLGKGGLTGKLLP